MAREAEDIVAAAAPPTSRLVNQQVPADLCGRELIALPARSTSVGLIGRDRMVLFTAKREGSLSLYLSIQIASARPMGKPAELGFTA